MPSRAKPIPEGFHTVTASLTVNNAARAIDFYNRAFGAKEILRMEGQGGKISHAEIKIGDSVVLLSDEVQGNNCRSPNSLGGSTANLHLYFEDVDSVFKQAISAGAQVESPIADMFWGDRYGKLTDPFGHTWSVATHKEDVPAQELTRRANEYAAKNQPATHAAG